MILIKKTLYLQKKINYLVGKDFKTLESSGFGYFEGIEEFIHMTNKIKAYKNEWIQDFKNTKRS